MSNPGASHAISVLSTVLNNANNERERMARILGRYHAEFATERQARLDAEGEVARLQNLLDAKTSEVAALTDRNVSLEREVKIMVSAIEVAGEQIRENQRLITDSVGRISSDLPEDLETAENYVGDVHAQSPDLPTDEIHHQFSSIERELLSLMGSRGRPAAQAAVN
jgi:chromosome segregation ATPase